MGTVPPGVLLGWQPWAVLLLRNLLLFPVLFKLIFCYLVAQNAAKIPALIGIDPRELNAIARNWASGEMDARHCVAAVPSYGRATCPSPLTLFGARLRTPQGPPGTASPSPCCLPSCAVRGVVPSLRATTQGSHPVVATFH